MKRLAFILQLLYLFLPTHAQTLKEAYRDHFLIGVAVNARNVRDSAQAELIKREFNSITSENHFKPQSLQPQEGVWNWEEADRQADFCRRNGIKMRGHCLVWHNQVGRWMFYEGDSLASKAKLLERMRTHIHTVVRRYADVVYCWDVVNEAITDDPNAPHPYRESLFYKIAGEDFLRLAFQYAREADPNALLFYNDYNECNPVKRDRICQMLRQFRQDGVPVDGFGMQGHYNIYGPSEEDFETAIQKYAEVVPHLHVTELDLRTSFEQGGQLQFSQGQSSELTPELAAKQADQYDMLFRVLRRNAQRVECVTFWNLGDRDSWLGQNNHPLLFDRDYQSKPAYERVVGWNHKHLVAFGDSYVRNHKRPFAETWHAQLADSLGWHYTNCGRNGSSVAWDRERFGPCMTKRLGEIPQDADMILVIAGHNDASLSHGNRDSLRQVRDSVASLCRQLRERFPQKTICWVTPWDVDRPGFKQVIKTIRQTCPRYGIHVLDAAHRSPIRVRDSQFRRRYFQAPDDTAHLNAEGHHLMLQWAMKEFARKTRKQAK